MRRATTPAHRTSAKLAQYGTALLTGALGIFGWVSFAAAQTGAQPAAAPPKAVLELYTSQGCSSCPPADALLKSYVARPDIIALTFPVDYWDYLGWKDTFAKAKFSERQRAYGKQRGDGQIYTPQMVVDGLGHTIGSNANEIDRAIASHATKFTRSRVTVAMRTERGQLLIETGNAPDGSDIKDANIWLALVQAEGEIPVRAGENRGKTLKYYNVVRELTPIGMWSGTAMTIRLDRDTISQPGAESFAVLLQNKSGQIIGAAMVGKL